MSAWYRIVRYYGWHTQVLPMGRGSVEGAAIVIILGIVRMFGVYLLHADEEGVDEVPRGVGI